MLKHVDVYSAPRWRCPVRPMTSDGPNMLDRDMTLTTDRVAGLIHRMLSERSLGIPSSHDDDLRSLGMSSLDMVNLVLSVESEFDLSIPESDITPAKFRSIATIGRLVGSLLPVT